MPFSALHIDGYGVYQDLHAVNDRVAPTESQLPIMPFREWRT
jgi:hypothetical protein